MLQEEHSFLISIEHAPIEIRKKIMKGLEFAKKVHDGQLRKSGHPYVIHVISVAHMLWEKFQDADLTVAGLLHDTIEDIPTVTPEDIYTQFGDTIGFLVDASSKNQKSFLKKPHMYFEEKIDRQLWAGMQDTRVFLLKIADRRHNLSSLSFLHESKQIRMTFETQALYKPLEEILEYETCTSVATIQARFAQYKELHHLSNEQDLKNILIAHYFESFGEQLYDLIYKNSNVVTWEISDLEVYHKLLETKEFNENATVTSLWTDAKIFKVEFYFTKGFLLTGKASKLQVKSFNSLNF